MAYIGLDVGTSGCKASVFDEGGRVLAQDYLEYDLQFPRPGWVELDPEAVWGAASAALKNAARAHGAPVEAISIASFGEAVAMLDASGAPVANSIYYTDVRGSDCLDEIKERMGQSVIEGRTGMPLNSMYTLPKLLWIARNRPQWLEKLDVLLPYSAYIAYKLTGDAAVDLSQASRMLMLNRERREWDDEILNTFGIERAWLPRLVPMGEVVGPMLGSVAQSLGFASAPVVVSGGHDQIAAALGAGVLAPGDAADGIGSSECITLMIPDGADLQAMYRHNFCAEPYALPGKSVSLAFSSAAGAALKWYRNTFEDRLHQDMLKAGQNTYDVLNARLSDEPSPLMMLPYLAGTGTPHMDAGATGVISGLTLSTTRTDIYRAIIEGMNYEMRLNLSLLRQSGIEVPLLTAVGGGSASERLLAIKADILNRPIRTIEMPQSGTTGLAMLCAVATGRFASLHEAAAALVRTNTVIEPSKTHQSRYDEKYEQYLRMYPASRAISRQ